jgi:hypothetical protein
MTFFAIVAGAVFGIAAWRGIAPVSVVGVQWLVALYAVGVLAAWIGGRGFSMRQHQEQWQAQLQKQAQEQKQAQQQAVNVHVGGPGSPRSGEGPPVLVQTLPPRSLAESSRDEISEILASRVQEPALVPRRDHQDR